MSRKDPRVIELQRQVRELVAARDAGTVPMAHASPAWLGEVDPVEFVLSDRYLAQPRLYPRQATLLKVAFLRDDMFTGYDDEVLGAWMGGFTRPEPPEAHAAYRGWHYRGDFGLPPDTLDRITALRAAGQHWFREIVAVAGRRAGKGHFGALCGAYILAQVLSLGDVHDFFEIPAGKQISMSVFAGSQAAARSNQWLDLVRTVVGAPCFWPYIVRLRKDRLVLATAADLANPNRPWPGSIEIVARESTELAGRGAASFALFFDEFAHVTATTSSVAADRLYAAATPALDQFRGFSFIYQASSPAHQLGQFFVNYQRALALGPVTGTARNPQVLSVQLPSWSPYEDWERANTIPTRPDSPGAPDGKLVWQFPKITRPIQIRDDEMDSLEADDPPTFRVERLALWANVTDPYLNPRLIDRMFAPVDGRVPITATTGALNLDYVAHGDPAIRRD